MNVSLLWFDMNVGGARSRRVADEAIDKPNGRLRAGEVFQCRRIVGRCTTFICKLLVLSVIRCGCVKLFELGGGDDHACRFDSKRKSYSVQSVVIERIDNRDSVRVSCLLYRNGTVALEEFVIGL